MHSFFVCSDITPQMDDSKFLRSSSRIDSSEVLVASKDALFPDDPPRLSDNEAPKELLESPFLLSPFRFLDGFLALPLLRSFLLRRFSPDIVHSSSSSSLTAVLLKTQIKLTH